MRTWDDETFVFNPASGHTHLLNAAAVHMLERLHEQALSSRDLCAEFDIEDIPGEQLLAHVEQQLQQLELLGLIRRSPSAG